MTLVPEADVFEAARRAHFAVALHDEKDFEGMRRAGRLAAEVLDLLVPEVKPGVTTAHLDKLAYDYVDRHGAHAGLPGLSRLSPHGLHLDQPCRLPRHSRTTSRCATATSSISTSP